MYEMKTDFNAECQPAAVPGPDGREGVRTLR
jgi:hypothetical protein